MGLELTADRHLPITSQTRYPLSDATPTTRSLKIESSPSPLSPLSTPNTQLDLNIMAS